MNGLNKMTDFVKVTALAVTLLVVQFGLVQHSIDHAQAHVDTACEYCVAGHQPGSPIPSVGSASEPTTSGLLVSQRVTLFAPTPLVGANGARAPPTLA